MKYYFQQCFYTRLAEPRTRYEHPMPTRIHRAILFALYQTSVAASILLLPLAIATKQVGVTLPAHRIVNRLEQAYDAAA